MVSIREKNRGQKSRDTASFKTLKDELVLHLSNAALKFFLQFFKLLFFRSVTGLLSAFWKIRED